MSRGCASARADAEPGDGQLAPARPGNGSLFGGPTNIQSDNTFTQTASNSNTATNVDAFLLFGRLGLMRG